MSCHKHRRNHCTKFIPVFFTLPTVGSSARTPRPLVVATGSGPFTIPAGFRALLIAAKGAGGGGGAGASVTALPNNVGGGGGGGGSGSFLLGMLTLGSGINAITGTVAIGTGGIGATSDAKTATDGNPTNITINTTPVTTIIIGGGGGGGNGIASSAIGVGGLAGSSGTASAPGVFIISDGIADGTSIVEFLINPAITGGHGSGGQNTAGDGGQGGFPPGTLISNVGIVSTDGAHVLLGGGGVGSHITGGIPIPCSSDPAFQPLTQAGIGGNGGGGGFLSGDPSTNPGCGGTDGTAGYVQLVAIA
jgi:hypothetical protein